MKRTYLIRITAVTFLLFAGSVYAQVRKPAPTGQVPKSYSGQQGNPYSDYKPKPTGQIAPAAGTIPQQNTSQANTASQIPGASPQRIEGQVPKVNSNQDPRTFPERYNPNPTTQSETVITTQETQTGQNSPVTTDQVIQTEVTTPVENGNTQTTTQQRTITKPRTAAPAPLPAVPATPQRLQPNY